MRLWERTRACSVNLARNGTALTYLAATGSSDSVSVFRVKLGKAPGAAELIADPSQAIVGSPAGIVYAMPSQNGKLVGFVDYYGFTNVADGVAPPVHFAAPVDFQFLQ